MSPLYSVLCKLFHNGTNQNKVKPKRTNQRHKKSKRTNQVNETSSINKKRFKIKNGS